MKMRNLATIQTIKSLDPIPEKDKIVLASFENVGWHVIVGKDDFKVGDKCIYIESDSVLPPKSEFEFLRKRCWNEKWQGFRIQSMKMAGVYSEGIVFSIAILPVTPMNSMKIMASLHDDGVDVTETLGIVKYDPEALEEQELQKKKKYGPLMRFLLRFPLIRKILYPKNTSTAFPAWAHHSDETRAQVLPYIYHDYQGVKIYATEKLDGQSCLFAMVRGKFVVCSRNLRLPKPKLIKGKYYGKNKYWETADAYDMEWKLREAKKHYKIDFYIQGEQCGPGICSNRLGLEKLKFYVFNVYDVTHKHYLEFHDMMEVCSWLGLEMVPLVEIKEFHWANIDSLVAYAKGNSLLNPNALREGVVIRPVYHIPPQNKMAGQSSFKVINQDYDEKWRSKEKK